MLKVAIGIYFTVLKHTVYFVSFHSYPSSLVFPLCQFEGRKDRGPWALILRQWRLCEPLANLEQLPPLAVAPPLNVPCPPSSAHSSSAPEQLPSFLYSREASARLLIPASAAGCKVGSYAAVSGINAEILWWWLLFGDRVLWGPQASLRFTM